MDHKNCLRNLSLLKEKDEVKFVIKDRGDYDFAKNICHQYHLFNRNNEILFSPVFEALESKQLVAWIVEDKLPVRLNMQIHKFIWEPQTQGV
jgi:7-carboxy-7-deazaguanine synthase